MLFELYTLPNGNAIRLEDVVELRKKPTGINGSWQVFVQTSTSTNIVPCTSRQDAVELFDTLVLEVNNKVTKFMAKFSAPTDFGN